MTVYERIKALCAERGLALRQLEKQAGLSNGNISAWKRVSPSRASLEKVAAFFSVPVDYLLGASEARTTEKSTRVPVYGAIPAGIPLEAISDVVDYEEISEDLALRGQYFGVRVKGESMEPELRSGDVLIVRCQPEAESGDIVVAGVNGDEACVKKLVVADGKIILQPLNPAFPPIVAPDVRIYGKAVEVRRRFL